MVSRQDGHKFAMVWVQYDLHDALMQDWWPDNIGLTVQVWFTHFKLCGVGSATHSWHYQGYAESRTKYSQEEWLDIVNEGHPERKVKCYEARSSYRDVIITLKERQGVSQHHFDLHCKAKNVPQEQWMGFPNDDDRFATWSMSHSPYGEWDDYVPEANKQEAMMQSEQVDWNLCG